jgi:hypothetical protein
MGRETAIAAWSTSRGSGEGAVAPVLLSAMAEELNRRWIVQNSRQIDRRRDETCQCRLRRQVRARSQLLHGEALDLVCSLFQRLAHQLKHMMSRLSRYKHEIMRQIS